MPMGFGKLLLRPAHILWSVRLCISCCWQLDLLCWFRLLFAVIALAFLDVVPGGNLLLFISCLGSSLCEGPGSDCCHHQLCFGGGFFSLLLVRQIDSCRWSCSLSCSGLRILPQFLTSRKDVTTLVCGSMSFYEEHHVHDGDQNDCLPDKSTSLSDAKLRTPAH